MSWKPLLYSWLYVMAKLGKLYQNRKLFSVDDTKGANINAVFYLESNWNLPKTFTCYFDVMLLGFYSWVFEDCRVSVHSEQGAHDHVHVASEYLQGGGSASSVCSLLQWAVIIHFSVCCSLSRSWALKPPYLQLMWGLRTLRGYIWNTFW